MILNEFLNLKPGDVIKVAKGCPNLSTDVDAYWLVLTFPSSPGTYSNIDVKLMYPMALPWEPGDISIIFSYSADYIELTNDSL